MAVAWRCPTRPGPCQYELLQNTYTQAVGGILFLLQDSTAYSDPDTPAFPHRRYNCTVAVLLV